MFPVAVNAFSILTVRPAHGSILADPANSASETKRGRDPLLARPFSSWSARLTQPERYNWNPGAHPPRALPTAPSPLAFRRGAPCRIVRPGGVEFGAGRTEQQPRRPRSPFLNRSCSGRSDQCVERAGQHLAVDPHLHPDAVEAGLGKFVRE